MPRDLPDYGALSAQATVYEITDLGELAARLGSIVTFDRRGDVLFLDAFEDGLVHWATKALGMGAGVELSAARARYGQFSVHLTAGSDSSRYGRIAHIMPVPVESGLGLEVGFSLASEGQYLLLVMEWLGPAASMWFQVRWRDDNHDLQVYEGAGVWTTFAAGLDLQQGATLFHDIKMVGDLTSGDYLRCLVDDKEYDLSAYSAVTVAGANTPRVNLYVYNYGRSGENDEIYVDDVIVTQNEPAQP